MVERKKCQSGKYNLTSCFFYRYRENTWSVVDVACKFVHNTHICSNTDRQCTLHGCKRVIDRAEISLNTPTWDTTSWIIVTSMIVSYRCARARIRAMFIFRYSAKFREIFKNRSSRIRSKRTTFVWKIESSPSVVVCIFNKNTFHVLCSVRKRVV